MAYVEYDRIVLFGDSITQGSFCPDEFGSGSALAHVYARRLDVINRGFSGYNSEWCLPLLRRILPPKKADAARLGETEEHGGRILLLVIFLGANDATLHQSPQHVPLSRFKDNLRTMIDMVRAPDSVYYAPHTRVLIISCPPIQENVRKDDLASRPVPIDLDRTAERTHRFAQAAIEVAKDYRLPFVDLWSAITKRAEEDGRGLGRYLSDGLHLSGPGYKVLYEEMMAVIKAQIPELDPQNLPEVLPVWRRYLEQPSNTATKEPERIAQQTEVYRLGPCKTFPTVSLEDSPEPEVAPYQISQNHIPINALYQPPLYGRPYIPSGQSTPIIYSPQSSRPSSPGPGRKTLPDLTQLSSELHTIGNLGALSSSTHRPLSKRSSRTSLRHVSEAEGLVDDEEGAARPTSTLRQVGRSHSGSPLKTVKSLAESETTDSPSLLGQQQAEAAKSDDFVAREQGAGHRTAEFYGFFIYCAGALSALLFILWATLPEPVLASLGIEWYPDRQWALLVPAYMVILTLFIYITALALALRKTSDLDDLRAITDRHALLPRPDVVPPPAAATGREREHERDDDWVPEVYDLPVSFVNEIMFQ